MLTLTFLLLLQILGVARHDQVCELSECVFRFRLLLMRLCAALFVLHSCDVVCHLFVDRVVYTLVSSKGRLSCWIASNCLLSPRFALRYVVLLLAVFLIFCETRVFLAESGGFVPVPESVSDAGCGFSDQCA